MLKRLLLTLLVPLAMAGCSGEEQAAENPPPAGERFVSASPAVR